MGAGWSPLSYVGRSADSADVIQVVDEPCKADRGPVRRAGALRINTTPPHTRSSMRLILLLATILALLLPAAANAEGTIQSEVARTGVWANTSDYTPAVYGSGSSPCWTKVKRRSPDHAGVTPPLATRLNNTPLPCYFKPAGGTDGEAVVAQPT